MPATLSQARRILGGLLGQPGGDSAAAHVLAAQIERLGSSRRKDERIREHLAQVTNITTCAQACVVERWTACKRRTGQQALHVYSIRQPAQ